jgi:hypothetical protein
VSGEKGQESPNDQHTDQARYNSEPKTDFVKPSQTNIENEAAQLASQDQQAPPENFLSKGIRRARNWWSDPYREKSKWTDIAIVALTIGIVILAGMQWKEMDEPGKQTDKIISSAKVIASSMEQSIKKLDAAREASETQNNKAIGASASLFQSDERAYIVIENFAWTNQGFAPGPNKIHRNETFRNAGKSPALHMHSYGCLVIYSLDTPDTELAVKTDALFVTAKTVNHDIDKKAKGTDRAPGQALFATDVLSDERCLRQGPLGDFAMTQQQSSDYFSDPPKIGFEHIGGVTYMDTFGKSHETQFCERITTGTAPFFCPAHNTIR